MAATLFTLLCEKLGYDPATVLVIRVTPNRVYVTYTEPSGMPRCGTNRFERDADEAA